MAGMRFLIIAAVISMLALGAGCQKQEQDADALAVTALYSPDAAANPGAKPVIPPEWPITELPMYPQAELATSNYNMGGPDSGCVLTLTTGDPGESVLEFYQERALAAGYQLESYVAASDSGAAYFKREDGYLNTGYRIENGQTVITLLLMFAINTEENLAFPGSGQLPQNFPIDKLPLFPGATILEARNMPMDNMLQMLAIDTKIKDVLAFYMAYYKDLDYKVLVEDKASKTFYHYVFEGPEGGVVLNLNQESDGSASIDMIFARR